MGRNNFDGQHMRDKVPIDLYNSQQTNYTIIKQKTCNIPTKLTIFYNEQII